MKSSRGGSGKEHSRERELARPKTLRWEELHAAEECLKVPHEGREVSQGGGQKEWQGKQGTR